jgi:hypothetical protein
VALDEETGMKLIVAEVVYECVPIPDPIFMLPKMEGTTYYPDARVFVITRDGTPPWINRMWRHLKIPATL